MTAEAATPLEGTPLIRPSSTDHPLYDDVVAACRTVYDPEIPVNIYDLGLVYTIDISPENAVEIVMTAHAAQWAPIRHHDTLHDRASYRCYWQTLERAHRTAYAHGPHLPAEVRAAFFDA